MPLRDPMTLATPAPNGRTGAKSAAPASKAIANLGRMPAAWRILDRLGQAARLVVSGDAGQQTAPFNDDVLHGHKGSCDLVASDLIDGREVFVIDGAARQFFDQVDRLATSAADVHWAPDTDAAMHMILHSPARECLLIVNIDALDDVTLTVERMLALRMLLPDVPVVLASETFKKNDFTTERTAITDASLRLPCSEAALAIAIEASVTNRAQSPAR